MGNNKKPSPYADRITVKNTESFADILRDAAAARSKGNIYAWIIGTDDAYEWQISGKWTAQDQFEVNLIRDIPETEAHNTITYTASQAFTVAKDDPKPVVIQQLKDMIDSFLAICGESPVNTISNDTYNDLDQDVSKEIKQYEDDL